MMEIAGAGRVGVSTEEPSRAQGTRYLASDQPRRIADTHAADRGDGADRGPGPQAPRVIKQEVKSACLELAAALGRLPQPAPDFTLKTHDGQDVKLSSLRGRVVLLNFWATWCPPCVKEMPELDRFAGKLEAIRAAAGWGVVTAALTLLAAR